MSKITLAPNAAGTATFTVAAPATSTDRTLNLPDVDGTLTVQGSTITSGTPVATTSGTFIDFTGIPSWVKRITVMLDGVSTNGTSSLAIQIGSGSVAVTGYINNTVAVQNATVSASTAVCFLLNTSSAAANTYQGIAQICLLSSSSNTWVEQSSINNAPVGGDGYFGSGSKSLTGVLDRVRITTLGGVNTFDAGTVNIMYEG